MTLGLYGLVVVCTACAVAGGMRQDDSPSAYRLVLEDGGYARLMQTPPSFPDFTLSAWVNVTTFPNGVAPILTAVAPDANSQVSFFLRHDGLGILWGGPVLPATRYPTEQVDRHPRYQWTPSESNAKQRQRREAADYSAGLGDIEDILADSRRGRSYDTWTPYSFVDVDQMGVTDLEAAPSGLNADLHLLPIRDGFSRSESYNDWTNVPYELTMLESDPYDLHLAEPEPRIITEPSGDDDFVFFNWNVPVAPKQTIPQSPHEWSPIWQPKKETQGKEIPEVKDPVEISPVKDHGTEDLDTSNSGGWSAQVTEVKLSPNTWIPHNIREPTFTTTQPLREPPHPPNTPARLRPVIQRTTTRPQPKTTTHSILKTTTRRPTTTTTQPVPKVRPTTTTAQPVPKVRSTTTTAQPVPKVRPTTTTAQPVPRVRLTTTTTQPVPKVRPTTTTTQPVPKVGSITVTTAHSTITTTRRPSTTRTKTTSPFNIMRLTTRRFTAPPTTLVPGLPTRIPTRSRTSTPLSRQATRMPLWKLIKQPNITKQAVSTPSTPKPITTTTIKTSTTTAATATTPPPTTTSSTVKVPTTRATTIKPTSHQPSPVPTVHSTGLEQATDKPQITGQKSKVSIWSSAVETHKSGKGHTYQDKWSGKPQELLNAINKQRLVRIMPYHLDEFHRAMKPVPPVKYGNTSVVYSIPITDVEAFNTMYQHYQAQEVLSSSSNHATVIHDDAFEIHEEETNENRLGGNNLPSPDESFPIHSELVPETNFEETAAPAILKEEEAVLVPTEEPLPPTPSRSDIPIHEDALDTSNHGKITLKESKITQAISIPVMTEPPKQETIQQESKPVVLVVIKEDSGEVQKQPISSHDMYDKGDLNIPSVMETTTAEESKATASLPRPNNGGSKSNIPSSVNSRPISVTTESDNIQSVPESSNVPLVSELIQIQHIPLPSNLPPIQEPTDIQTVPRPSDITIPPASDSLPLLTELSDLLNAQKQNISTESEPNFQDNLDSTPETELEPSAEGETEQHSTSFAVFHFDDVNPFYPPEEEGEDTFLEDLYQPAGVLVTQDDVQPVSYYQESSHLYHEQLPPQYISPKEAPRPIAYGGPLQQSAAHHQDQDDLKDIVFSADPQELIKQGFLPRPVHYVSTQEEADEWMQEHSPEPKIEDRVFTVESTDAHNHMSQAPEKNSKEDNANFHFKKVPFDFKTNQWYHLAFTWSSTDHQAVVYINGEKAGTLTDVMPNQMALAGGGLTIIGQTLLPDLTDFDSTSQFIGEISDVNMWGQRLGAESIHAVYHCAQMPKSPALNWHQLSMRFYSDVFIKEAEALCGA